MIRHPKTQEEWQEVLAENTINGVGVGNLGMSSLTVLTYPNPFLFNKSIPLIDAEFGTNDLVEFAERMYSTMFWQAGVGLSAVQVGILKRIIVMKIPETSSDGYDISRPYTFCNPEIISVSDDVFAYREGCLSVPGYFEERTRPQRVLLKWRTVHGTEMQEEFTNLEAFCILHEIDHLDGKLFIDDLSAMKRDRVRKVINKTLRERQRENERR